MEPPKQATGQQTAKLPQLEVLNPTVSHSFSAPSKCINEGPDVARFLTSKAYRDIGVFVMQLNRALCPRKSPSGPSKTFPLVGGNRQDTATVRKLRELLDRAAKFIGDAPPDPGPRRFGNISFRKWYQLLEQNVDRLLREFVSDDILDFRASEETTAQHPGPSGEGNQSTGAIDELKAYFLGGYLNVVRRLILTYNLEPAGSHGVWGLDDHAFMPYIFGSAQFTRPITEDESMPLEGSVERAPKPGDILKPEVVERLRETNMYFSAVGFINDVKKGPFWEHSPILYDVSGIKDGWGKINKGMIKMFNAEVLSKFPVVQHFPFGSLFSWDSDPEASAPQQVLYFS
ncbi:putative serine threonine-protein phosphatase 2a activator 1 [Diaporthe ampelina]|uniref:Serine/threonine-protein phosphatase 2A activator n=1 Tax=Diaporthe ampelina TaxID=1214573 RepID=A0A0G2FHJ2_9PEZI|nr:putative serine threonine-protein phosphatase 2a activator 1 [Diaporthe ampelina]